MALSDYLVPIMKNDYTNKLCFQCERACGNCPWSEIDPETKKPRFAPVPGWTAKKVVIRGAHREKV